jgi:hypothetical protein
LRLSFKKEFTMFNFPRLLRGAHRAESGSPARKHRKTHLQVEALEERQLMAVTFHGGAVLKNVAVQGLYYGANWAGSLSQDRAKLDGFLKDIVQSSYMDMLTGAGYNVGRGGFTPGYIDTAQIDNSQFLNDGQIRAEIRADIINGSLQEPVKNKTLYMVFVEDNVGVQDGAATSTYQTSSSFRGYHSAFTGTDVNGQSLVINYAVMPYPGGSFVVSGKTYQNKGMSFLPAAADEITAVASHELAEAVTDPHFTGWKDNKLNEIGDITGPQFVELDGYIVQRIADKNDQPMTPAGATAVRAVTFVLETNGDVYEYVGGTPILLMSNVAAVSDQGIDNHARAMIDVVTTGGAAYEFHDDAESGKAWVQLGSNVESAKAGQGVSYVLFRTGPVRPGPQALEFTLQEYRDVNQSWTYISRRVSAIDAGTDQEGVNAVDVIYNLGRPLAGAHLPRGAAYEYSDNSGWEFLTNGVESISAGQQGITVFVTFNANSMVFDQSKNAESFLASNVAKATAGTAQKGKGLIDILFTGGDLDQCELGSGLFTAVDSNVETMSKARAGVLDEVFAGGDAYEREANNALTFLRHNAKAAV